MSIECILRRKKRNKKQIVSAFVELRNEETYVESNRKRCLLFNSLEDPFFLRLPSSQTFGFGHYASSSVTNFGHVGDLRRRRRSKNFTEYRFRRIAFTDRIVF